MNGVVEQMLTVYLHGMPGSPDELKLFGEAAAGNTSGWFVPDRYLNSSLNECDSDMDALVAAILQEAHGRDIRLVGFSGGSRAAIGVGARLPECVKKIDLVSPIAPLETGDFTGKMVGGKLMAIASRWPRAVARIASTFSSMNSALPWLVYEAYFVATARGADRRLVFDNGFRKVARHVLSRGLKGRGAAFAGDTVAYAQSWIGDLRSVRAPIEIWHGDKDNWVPIEMAEAIKSLQPASILHRLAGYSHYSTLKAYLTNLSH